MNSFLVCLLLFFLLQNWYLLVNFPKFSYPKSLFFLVIWTTRWNLGESGDWKHFHNPCTIFTRRSWISDDHQRVNNMVRVFAVEIGPTGHEIAAHCFSTYLSCKLKTLWKKMGREKMGLEENRNNEEKRAVTRIYPLETRLNLAYLTWS